MTEFRKYIPLFLFGDENMIDIDKMVDGYYSGSQFYPGGGYKTSDWIDVSHFDFPSVFNLKWTNSSTTANLKVIRFGANKNYLGDWTTIYPYSDPDGDNRSAFVTEPAAEQYVSNTTFNNSTTIYNAVAGGLKSITAKGICTQASTPTPDAPVDIVCNNGAIKARHQSGLPLGYQLYEYLTANGTKWLNTGVQLTSSDIIETEFINSSTSGFGALYGVFAMGDSSAFYANGTYYGYDSENTKIDTGIAVDTVWHTLRQDFGNGIITLDGNDTTYTPFEFENTNDNYLFARYYNNSYGYGFKGSCKRFKVIRNGVLICDLIPVVQLSDNAIGMYDIVNNVFRNNLGSGTFTISNPIDDPVEIYYDGTPEVLTVSASGAEAQTASVENLLSVGNYKDEQEIVSGKVTRKVGVKVFDGTEEWLENSTSSVFRYRVRIDNCVGGTNRTELLSSHFNYISSGQAVGGAFLSSKYLYVVPEQTITTVNDFKSWVATQYTNGTPVMFIYPLLDETTDSVAGQELTLTDGTNYVSATGSTTPLSFDANYTIKGEDVAYLRVTMVNTTTDLGMYKTYEYSHSTSIINPDTLIQGLYNSSGEFDATNVSFLTTDLIPVTNGEYEIDWVRYGYGNLSVRVTAFDENKQFESQTNVGENPDSSATYTISDNTIKYIAISYPKNLSRVYRAYKK